MYRPALVIGLGGTGVLTLRHLKAQLRASKEHHLPPQVKLIALDTVSNKGQSAPVSDKVQIEALRTELEPGEYYWIGGDVYEFVRDIGRDVERERKEYPNIGSWFQADTYLKCLARASFTLDRGAGQLRQFGRLAIFHDVSAPARSSIYSLLNRAINDIRRTGFFPNLDVFLIASVAGGTGAGMFVDIAYLVRQIAKQDHDLATRLRGFMVLPEAFSKIPGGVKSAMRARAFACMRENKRFMVDFQYEHGYPMYYHASGIGGIWHASITTKLFDFLYHVDGQSQQNPLTNVLPEYGVTAAIADAITAMLDSPPQGEEDVYDQHTTNVIAQASDQMGHQVERGTISFDSAIGGYSLILPMHHISEWLAYRLTLAALDDLLVPEVKDEDGYPTSLSIDANAEIPGTRGREGVPGLLQAADIYSLRTGERIANTPFFRELARVALNYTPRDPTIAQELSSREAYDWEVHLEPPGTTSEITAVRQRVQQELARRLVDEVPPNVRGERAGGALERISRGIENYKGYHLGREDFRTGQRMGGQYQQALEDYARIQLERYRLMLQTECENILNGGQNPDALPSVHRGGKLGYLIDFMEGLEEMLGRFLKALHEAGEMRESRGEKQARVTMAETTRQELETNPGGIFGGRRRQAYLNAEQDLADMEKAIIIENTVRKLADSTLQYTRQLRENAQTWVTTLGIGYNGLYGWLLRGRRRIEDAIRAEQSVPVREFVWDQDYLDDLYDKYAFQLQAGVDDYLGRLLWNYEQQRTGTRENFGFRLSVRISEDEAQNRVGLENQQRNLELLLTPAREVFASVWEQESILKYLMTKKFTDPNTLADLLADKGGFFLNATGPSMVPANYLHVAHGRDPAERDYLDAIRRRLANRTQARGELTNVVNSSDRFALRLVHTMDLIPLDGIASYRKAESDYWSHAGEVEDGRGIRGRLGRETLHLFPAEVNAARLETRIQSKLGIPNRALHNDIVLQMEDMDRFRLFVRCWAFELIRRDRREGGSGGYENFWCLALPEEDTGSLVRGPEEALKIYLTRPASGDPDIVEAMKIWNYQRRDVRSEIEIPIDYARARRAVQVIRDQVMNEWQQKDIGIDNATLRERVEALPKSDQERFQRLWLERRYLEERQEELEPVIRNEQANVLDRDAAIARYMVLDDDIESLNLAMDDILKSAGRVR